MEKSRMHKDQLRRGTKASWETTIRKAQLQFRGCTIFSAMSVLPYDEDASSEQRVAPIVPPPELHHMERLLPNGDFYTGLASWSPSSSSSSSSSTSSSSSSSSDMMPHGAGGKYLWTDGCMYEGDWMHGKATGKGKFSWPSGATYEGDFKSWLLDGSGIFTGASGDTYRGSYSMNLKHGRGRRTYPNGDYYDGEWRRGQLEGHGRYVWKVGHEYNGSWKGGSMSGKGVLFWANGNSFDGEWDEGVPCGKGQFRWPDGGVFVGIWTKDRRSHRTSSTILISASPENVRREPEEELEFGLADCKVCPGENMLIYPSEKVIHWTTGSNEGEHEKKNLCRKLSCVTDPSGGLSRFKKASAESVQSVSSPSPSPPAAAAAARRASNNGYAERASSTWGSDAGRLASHSSYGNMLTLSEREPTTPVKLPLPGEMKKQGQTISKGHKNYELMLTLQLGIRHSVGKTTPVISLDLKPSAFNPKEKFWTRFPPEGSKHTPPHQSCEFRWKDYCPAIFRTLRKLFKVDPADYMLSICGNDALREFSSPGKSGSFFYLSHDDRYMIKTVKKADIKVIRKMLPGYYKHVRAFENTLLTKFYGLHCVKLAGATQKKVRFVIMGNLFCTNYPIHRRFDLKGSSHGRTTDKPESEIDETTTLKDLDLNFIFRLEKSLYQAFVRQIERDCQFLENEKIMDYSLLVGLHFREMASLTDNTEADTYDPAGSRNGSPGLGFGNGRYQPFKLGISMPCLVEQVVRRSDSDQQNGEPSGELYEAILFFGIIDILQDYDISKKLEHAYKSMHYDSTTISSVDPKLYAKRFCDFILHIFQEES